MPYVATRAQVHARGASACARPRRLTLSLSLPLSRRETTRELEELARRGGALARRPLTLTLNPNPNPDPNPYPNPNPNPNPNP